MSKDWDYVTHKLIASMIEPAVCLLQIDVWNRFDVFQVANLSKNAPLETVTLALFSRHDLLEKLKIPYDRLQRFVRVCPTSA